MVELVSRVECPLEFDGGVLALLLAPKFKDVIHTPEFRVSFVRPKVASAEMVSDSRLSILHITDDNISPFHPGARLDSQGNPAGGLSFDADIDVLAVASPIYLVVAEVLRFSIFTGADDAICLPGADG